MTRIILDKLKSDMVILTIEEDYCGTLTRHSVSFSSEGKELDLLNTAIKDILKLRRILD